jgi:hypothetical protein
MSAGNRRFSFFQLQFYLIPLNPVKKLLNFATATVSFGLVMYLSIEAYLYVTGQKVEDVPGLSVIVVIKDIAYFVAISCYIWILGCMMKDYANPPLPLNEVCETEMGFTVIDRDQEGEEIRRTRHTVKVYHTIPENMIHETMERWRRFSENSTTEKTAEALCDYINMRTPYYAAVTKEELINRLKNK